MEAATSWQRIQARMHESIPRLFLFGVIGGLGTIINTALLFILNTGFGWHYLVAAAVATETAIVSNFFGNHFVTFRAARNDLSLARKFWRFQLVSMFALILTLAILSLFVTLFGERLLLVWNLVAIVITFLANYMLNKKFTWHHKAAAVLLVAVLFASVPVHAADVVAISQLGYHPDQTKEVVVYTDKTGGTFTVKRQGGGVAGTFELFVPTNYEGEQVSCQGGIPCLVGDFSSLTDPGTYYIESEGTKSAQFTIASDTLENGIGVLLEFFEAMRQQGSPYHADLHSAHSPAFLSMSDGSFIMESHQAAITLIRLGSAYRSNPAIFGTQMSETISEYVTYLAGLQGLEIDERNDATGFRLNPGLSISGAFVPGPTDLVELDVYGPGENPQLIQTVPVRSLCGEDDGTPQWQECIDRAATYYKCQIDEPCLDLVYEESTGVVVGHEGFGVARGWGYEFGCYVDIDLEQGNFNDAYNPCSIFYPEQTRENTVLALHGFLEAVPAIWDESEAQGDALYNRALSTYEYVRAAYAPFRQGDADVGHWGTGLFLLYDYSGDPSYLEQAHALRDLVPQTLISDRTRGNEFYWEEYARHEAELLSHNLPYEVDGQDPAEFFRGKIFHDYKDRGLSSISNNGERVYEFDHNIQFQNSRYMLLEALYAAKAAQLNTGAEEFIPRVADSQIQWLTGKNLVQDGVGLDAPLRSYSFIFGIGDFPAQYHSRYLVDTGYASGTAGEIIGARGTDLQFSDGQEYVYLDGRSRILGREFGAFGNRYAGEAATTPFHPETTFSNGKNYIPGWINGAFDTKAENDVIFNYRDNLETYEFTETTDEMVAIAVELFAASDARLNMRDRHPGISKNESPLLTGGIRVRTSPEEVSILLDGKALGTSDANGTLFIAGVEIGEHELTGEKQGYGHESVQVLVLAELNATAELNLSPAVQGGALKILSDPAGADVGLNGTYKGTTNGTGELLIEGLSPGPYALVVTKQGYLSYMDEITIMENRTAQAEAILEQQNSTGGVILNGSTNVTDGHMFETETAGFSVTLNGTGEITWTVNGKTVKTAQGASDTLAWTPGPLFTSNVTTVTVAASAGGESEVWAIDVEYVVNPFFSALDGSGDVAGSPDTQVHIFTNDRAYAFTGVNATIRSPAGDTLVVLEPFPNPAKQEIDWRADLPNVPEGNNYVHSAKGAVGNGTVEFLFGTARAHYRQESSSERDDDDDDDDDRSFGGGGGGGAPPGEIEPELVYALFTEDVLDVNGTQEIRLDASIGIGGNITKVEAQIEAPTGYMRSLELDILEGTHTYGTWAKSFDTFRTGEYELSSVTIYDRDEPFEFTPEEKVAFYVVSDAVAAEEEFGLVYTALNASRVTNGSQVRFTTDVRDAQGIVGVEVEVTTNRGSAMTLPLEMTSGNPQYGTWEGTLLLDEPDTTYTFKNITLTNEAASKTYELKARMVYVEALPQDLRGMTGNVVSQINLYSRRGIEQFLKEPLVPTMVGFALMVITMGAVLVTHKLRSAGDR